MKELICKHSEGWKVRTLIESSVIVETINDLRRNKGFQSFIIKSISTVNPENYDWRKGGQWLSAN